MTVCLDFGLFGGMSAEAGSRIRRKRGLCADHLPGRAHCAGGDVRLFDTIPTEMRERLSGSAIRSITQPLLILCVAFSLPALIAGRFLSGVALYVDVCLAAAFPLMFAITHFYFMFVQPDRLQSEDFRLRDRSLSIIETNRGVVRDPGLLEVTASSSEGLLFLKTPVDKSGTAVEPGDASSTDAGSNA